MIYFVRCGADGPIKIGFAAKLRQRLMNLQSCVPFKIEVLGVMDGDLKAEAELHRRFSAHRVQGEWFSPAAEILSFVDARCSPFDFTRRLSRGRPPLPNGERRDKELKIRVTRDELQAIRRRAKSAKQTLTAYVLAKMLGPSPRPGSPARGSATSPGRP